MSVAGISSVISVLSQLGQHSAVQATPNPFQQLGQDLASGNTTAAQSDYSSIVQALTANRPAGSTSAAQAFSQLGKDLQSGNLGAAQQDYSQFQADLQQLASGLAHGHHGHHRSGASENPALNASQQVSDAVSLFTELGQSLQSGNLAAAQQTYASLQQDLSQFSVPPANKGTASAGILNLSA